MPPDKVPGVLLALPVTQEQGGLAQGTSMTQSWSSLPVYTHVLTAEWDLKGKASPVSC